MGLPRAVGCFVLTFRCWCPHTARRAGPAAPAMVRLMGGTQNPAASRKNSRFDFSCLAFSFAQQQHQIW